MKIYKRRDITLAKLEGLFKSDPNKFYSKKQLAKIIGVAEITIAIKVRMLERLGYLRVKILINDNTRYYAFKAGDSWEFASYLDKMRNEVRR